MEKVARPVRIVQINGQSARALFDTGSIRSYIRSGLVRSLPRVRLSKPVSVGLGGRVLSLRVTCLVEAQLEGYPFDFQAYPVPRIGQDETGQEIDLLIGAAAMEQWGMTIDPRTGRIDLRRLKKREFTEY
ncbi:MAG: retropepsin-like aspartic protease [Candidatus Methylomirabilales bacterium]